MKKIAKYFFAALAVASAVSCAKELTDDFRPADKVQQGKSYTFTATMADTKSVIDEETLEILWSGDENNMEYITVLEPAATGITAKAITYSAEVNKYEPTSVANFSQHNEEAAGVVGNTVFAVYPAGDWKSFSNADSLGVAVTFATEQNAVAGTYDPKAPVAVAYNNNVAENQDLHFQNTSALLKLQLAPTTGKVNTITVYSLGGETLAGEILLMNKGGVPSMVPVKETAKSYVNLNFKEYEAGATYYIAVAPATLSKGIALQFNGDEVQTYTISDEIVIERGKVYDLGVFACAEPEDAWYLIGDYNVGNANTLRKTEFVEVEGEDLLVAKDVTIRELQGFKVYNPSTGVTYYPEVNDLEVNEWFPLTKEAGYGYTSSSYNVYDVYVDYVNKEMTGILLVDAGSAVPGFALPEGVFMHTTEEAGSFALCIDLENEVLKQGQFYDDYAKYMMPKDPSMEGKWYEATKTSEFTITPETAMSGKITYSDQWGPVVVNYSNYCRDSISLVSDVLAGYEELRNCVIVDEEPEFAYPVPSGLFFYMSADYESNYILDLGSEDGYTFRQGQLFMDYEVPSGAEEFYNFFGVNGDPYCQVDNLGEVYQVNPESNTAGVIYVKIGKNYYQLNYSNYEFNNAIKIDSPEDMEEQPVLDENGEQMEGGWPSEPLVCYGLGLEIESAFPYPMEAPRYFTYEIPAEMPTDYETPEGNAYTWFDESYSADMLIDFGEVITKAYNYSQAMIPEGGEEYPIEEIWWNPELAGYWVSQGEVYSDYTVMPTAADAGIITFVKDVTNMWGETMTQYFRIEYSDLTAESVKLFSPSSFNIPVYDTETGDQVMNEMYEMPYSWDGIGLMSFDEDYNSLPVEVSLLEEAPSIYVEDNSKMNPDEAQWVIYDPAVAEYFVGVSQIFEGAEARTLLNLGASDLSWMAGPNFAGSFIHMAISYEDLYGADAAGVWMATQNFGPTTPYEVIPSEEDPSSGKIVIKSAGMSEGLDLEDESEGEMAIYYMGYNPYGGMCYFDFSDFGLESEQPFLAFITPTKDLMFQ
ncbi:MAG: hypothetical protein IJN52_10245 [Bacteroidales bacterium]|nr:hypothetical protein [Bacteroidales bacterium]